MTDSLSVSPFPPGSGETENLHPVPAPDAGTDEGPPDPSAESSRSTSDTDGTGMPSMEKKDSVCSGEDPATSFYDREDEEPPVSSALWSDLPDVPDDVELNRLRELLFQRELVIIQRLKDSLSDPRQNAKRVSEVVAEALLLRGDDNRLNTALEPAVNAILKSSLNRHQSDFVGVLFPLMGPSIRKSIAATFLSMLEGFSKSLEMSFSWKGLRWRIEALRTGKPFSEIVLLHTLAYRVEQLFFIHSETGLVLSHLTNEGIGTQDVDMVSAMLTAIQDFVRDCFANGSEGELESLHLGEFTIFIEKYSRAYLACVLRGTPPVDFREGLRATLETMLIEFTEPLESFSGDTAPFIGAARHLEPYLVTRYQDEGKKLPWWAKALPLFAFLALVGGIAFFQYHAHELKQQQLAHALLMQEGLNFLRNEPGLMLTHVDQIADGPWEVMLLRDDLAREPEDVLRAHGFQPDAFTFNVIPHVSYDSSIVTRRTEKAIDLPPTVSMHFTHGVLTFTGTAPLAWIAGARDTARTLPGVKHVDISGVKDPLLDRITAMINSIESTSIEFLLGKALPVATDIPKLDAAVDTLVELEKLVKGMGFVLSLTIYGHTDTTGTETRNYEISQERTRTVAAMLYARGASIPISMYGMGSQYPKGERSDEQAASAPKEDQASRRIELRVHIARSATSGADIFAQ
jgi:Outer membrane protein and related peptidoglycan-associated (lipo)proteins